MNQLELINSLLGFKNIADIETDILASMHKLEFSKLCNSPVSSTLVDYDMDKGPCGTFRILMDCSF